MFHLLTRGKTVFLFLVTTLILFSIVMFMVNPKLDGGNGLGVIQLQLAFSLKNAQEIIHSWPAFSVWKFTNAMLIDSLYALSYTLFFTSLVAWLLERKNLQKSVYRYVLILPLIAGCLDWFENSIEVLFISLPESVSEQLFLLHSIAACVKWLCLPVVFSFIFTIWKK